MEARFVARPDDGDEHVRKSRWDLWRVHAVVEMFSVVVEIVDVDVERLVERVDGSDGLEQQVIRVDIGHRDAELVESTS